MGGFYKTNIYKSIFNRTSLPGCTTKSYQLQDCSQVTEDTRWGNKIKSVRYTTGVNADLVDGADHVHI